MSPRRSERAAARPRFDPDTHAPDYNAGPRDTPPKMPGGYKDEDVLLIAPGSLTTFAQLGIGEPHSLPKIRIKSRMFKSERSGEWEPFKVTVKKRKNIATNGAGKSREGVAASDVDAQVDEEAEWEEDRNTDDGAVWPIVRGRISDWSCFFALLTHVYNTSSPTLKSPIAILLPPNFTPIENSKLAGFIFENFKPPALLFMKTESAALMAFKIQEAGLVVDVGYEKCDVIAFADGEVPPGASLLSIKNCGGRSMTLNLLKLLKPKGFTEDMCEQLKHSNICEILPPDVKLPNDTGTSEKTTNPAATASTGLNSAANNSAVNQTGLPRGPGPGTELGEDNLEDNEGVLDVASLVASGKTSEYLAKKEREKAEKAEKAAAKKGSKGGPTATAKAQKLPNSQKARVTFHFTSHIENFPTDVTQYGTVSRDLQSSTTVRKEIEIGTERFKAAGQDHHVLFKIADAMFRCIQACQAEHRNALWNNIIMVGNGAKIRGFREALMAILQSKYIVSATNGTMFTSELPSNFSTPIPTGANTPLPQANPTGLNLHHPPGVNPLLVAATTASNPALAPPGMQQHQQFRVGQSEHSVSRPTQGPTSVQFAKAPDYHSQWKEHGYDEVTWLGAQIGAHVMIVAEFNIGNTEETYPLKRTEFNKLGPSGIHVHTF